MSKLVFEPNGQLLFLTFILLGVLGVLSWLEWKKARYLFCEIPRWMALLLIAVLSFNPVIQSFESLTRSSTLTIITDETDSMNTLDVVKGNGLQSRKEQQSALMSSLDEEFKERLKVELDFRSIPSKENSTDLSQALYSVLNESSNPKAVFLLSDGDWNAGEDPRVSALQYKQREIPLYALTLGSEDFLPDLALSLEPVPSFVEAGKRVQVVANLSSTLGRKAEVSVDLLKGDTIVESQRVSVEGEKTAKLIFTVKAAEGLSEYRLKASEAIEELNLENNEVQFTIEGKAVKSKVLVIESVPRWEYRFIRNALQRDPNVELNTLLINSDGSLGGGAGYLEKFPTQSEFLKYEVIFLGDVGVETPGFTPEVRKNIARAVSSFGTGLIFLPGREGHQHSLVDTELEPLLPVVYDQGAVNGFTEPVEQSMELTEAGARSLLTLLGDNAKENKRVWAELPGFQWVTAVAEVKTGSRVLAVHAERGLGLQNLPLIVSAIRGSGKVLYMGTDSVWKWRKGVEDLYHYRFWGQVVRWMSYQRNFAKSEQGSLSFSNENPIVNDALGFELNAFDKVGEPLNLPSISAKLISPEGKIRFIQFKKQKEWGKYAAQAYPDDAGKWAIELPIEETILRKEFTVSSKESEEVGAPANKSIMDDLVEISGGKAVSAESFLADLEAIANEPVQQKVSQRMPLAQHWITVLVIFLLLFTHWAMRRGKGYV